MKMYNRFTNKFTKNTFSVKLSMRDKISYIFKLKPRHNWNIGQVSTAQCDIRKMLQNKDIKGLKSFCKLYEIKYKVMR